MVDYSHFCLGFCDLSCAYFCANSPCKVGRSTATHTHRRTKQQLHKYTSTVRRQAIDVSHVPHSRKYTMRMVVPCAVRAYFGRCGKSILAQPFALRERRRARERWREREWRRGKLCEQHKLRPFFFRWRKSINRGLRLVYIRRAFLWWCDAAALASACTKGRRDVLNENCILPSATTHASIQDGRVFSMECVCV